MMTNLNRDFVDLLCAFSDAQVDYLLVGAHALAVHGHVRATKDLDIWVRPTRDNAERAYRALAAFGAPLDALSVDDLATPGIVFQIGLPPVRIDILTRIDGLEFADAWQGRMVATLAGLSVQVLSRNDLITNKRASGRAQDLADLERLESIHRDPER